MLDQYYRVCARIDLDAIIKNVNNIKERLTEGTRICAVVKADAYGHGAVPVARALKDVVDFYAVATIDEALNLRAHEIFAPILVLGYIHPSKYKAAIENDIRITIFDFDMLKDIEDAATFKNKKALVHIKIDTGMNRIGITCDDKGIDYIKSLNDNQNIEVEGIYTHFYLSDAYDKSRANIQHEKFSDLIFKLTKACIDIPIKHCANSAAAIDMPYSSFDMVRLGIAMYGLYPSDEVTDLKLYPSLSLKSHIIMIKDVKDGESVGYGGTYIAKGVRKIATIPVGYGDGYQRNLSNKGQVMINNQRCDIVGRVCMDMFMADVTEIGDVKKGDEVILIGGYGTDPLTIEELAKLSNTFNYEFACDIGKRIPRIYYSNDKMISYKDYFFDNYI